MAPLSTSTESALRCQVAGWSLVRACADEVSQRRRQPIEVGGEKLPISFLKHAEDQTVLAVRAVLSAIDKAHWQTRSFRDWGVVASPHQFGRHTIAQSILRYANEGAWGVSPQLIPHQSLHAMSGAISQALAIHGPNFGVAGGLTVPPDVFLIAASLLADGVLPGLWVLLTGYDAEWIPRDDGSANPAPACTALALALTPIRAAALPPGETYRPHLPLRWEWMSSLPEGTICLSIGYTKNNLHLPDLQFDRLVEAFSAAPEGKWRIGAHWLTVETSGALAPGAAA